MSYTELKSYKQATAIYDFTVNFCARYIEPGGSYKSDGSYNSYSTYRSYKWKRMSDQMIQAARSVKQNIVEGTAASKNNPKSELMLLGVARASCEELLEDYEDFLRQKGLAKWDKDDPRAVEIRQLAYRTDTSDKTNRTYKFYSSYASYLNDPEGAANAMITLINQTNFLLDNQIQAVRNQHQESGVMLESREQKLTRILYAQKKKEDAADAWVRENSKGS